MKKVILLLLFCISYTAHAQYSQTRTAGNVLINTRVSDWINYSPSAFASDDNLYASTKITSGQHPVFFDHFGFNIPSNATITKLVCSVRKFKSGKSEVKDYDGLTWFLARCYCSFTPDCNCDYGPAMRDLNAWSTKESVVKYEQDGVGSFTRTAINEKGEKYTQTLNYAWTPEKVNDIMFGFTFNPNISIKGGGAAIYIDQLQVTIYYTLPSTNNVTHTVAANEIQLSTYNNNIIVDALLKGRYLVTITDRSGIVLQRQYINNPNKYRFMLNEKAKGYLIITVEGMGTRRSIQSFINK